MGAGEDGRFFHGLGPSGHISPGHTHVFIGIDDRVVGSIEISDAIREGTAEVLRKLIKAGITPVMLSGDQKETAQYVAQQIGISPDNVIAGVTQAVYFLIDMICFSESVKTAAASSGAT